MSNILPLQEKKDIRKMLRLRYSIVAAVFLVLALAIFLLLTIPTQVLLRGELGAAQTQVQAIKAKSAQVQIDQSLAAIQNTLGDLEKKLVLADVRPIYKTAQVILANPRDGIVINSFDISQNPGAVHLVGIARDRAALEAMAAYLETLPGVKSVESPLSNFIKSKQSPFSLTVAL